MAPMMPWSGIARRIAIKLGASFVHSQGTSVEHCSMQRSDSCLRFRRLRHLDESNPAWFTRISVLEEGDRFNGAECREGISQLLLCHRDIEVSDKDISHKLILSTIFRNAWNQKIRVRI
jgi:hypothetical protein